MIILWAIALLLMTASVHAHQAHLYDLSCCSNRDCKPVVEGVVTEIAGGVLVKGHGILSETDPRLRWSRDNQDHVCASPVDHKLRCVYRRFKGF